MTNATKTLTIIFVSLLVLTGLKVWMSDSGSSEAFRQKLLDYNPKEVTRIEIESPNRDHVVVVQRQDTNWVVKSDKSEEHYPANANMVTSALERMNELNVKAVVSRDTSDFSRFKVDETGTNVRFYAGNEKVGEIIVGAPQMASRRNFNTYVRPSGAEAVYSVEGFLSANINKDVEEWREKSVWNIDRNNITQIDLVYPADSSFSIMKAKANKWTSVGDTLDQTKVDRIINRVSSLRANGFSDSLSVEQFHDPLYTIRLHLSSGVQHSVRLKLPEGKEPSSYLATASDYPYVFTVSKSIFDNSVLFGREQLLPEEE